MYTSIFDLFKVGIGPSSSHTVGPMKASNLFINQLSNSDIGSITITVYGSLSLTGIGHGTDIGIIGGLFGLESHSSNYKVIKEKNDFVVENKSILIPTINKEVKFNIDKHLIFSNDIIDKHKYSNAINYKCIYKDGKILNKLFYSIGGGFIVDHDHLDKKIDIKSELFDFDSAVSLLKFCALKKLCIHEVVLNNEILLNENNKEEIKSKILNIWKIMNKSIYNGMRESGILYGGLKIRKRANALYKKLIKDNKGYDPLDVMDWVNVFAIAVAEENASFGRIVTAPTNGAAGIIPSVIKYYLEFVNNSNEEGVIRFLLTASAIGVLYKKNASISGAEAGCQGEIGVACSMAAGGLVAAMGGTNEQIENAAEIGMEHNLGLTCDPVGGLVQIPCIERNAMGAMKAINAARISLNGSGQHKVSLDDVIKTMWETGKNMNKIYKETSKGGLAVNVTEC